MSRDVGVDRQAPGVFPSHVVLKDLRRRAGGFAYEKLVAPRRDVRPVARHLRNLASIANELLGRPLRPAAGDAGTDAVPAPAPVERKAGAASGKAPSARVLVY